LPDRPAHAHQRYAKPHTLHPIAESNETGAGAHTIVSRVTDVNGQVQATPDQMPQKPSRWENYAQFKRTVTIA